jgi:hypothetical protein
MKLNRLIVSSQSVLAIILLILVLLFSLHRALGLFSFSLKNGESVAYIHDNSLIFEDGQNGQVFMRVSPYDDYFYTDRAKRHVAERRSLTRVRSIEEYLSFLQSLLFKPSELYLSIEDGAQRPSITYKVSFGEKKQFVLSRTLSEESRGINAIGQSFVLCYNCIVTDDQGYAYFNYELLAERKEDYAKALGLVVFSIHRNQPLPGVGTEREIVVRDALGKRMLSVYLMADDIVYYDEKYRLLEIKRELQLQQPTEVVITF